MKTAVYIKGFNKGCSLDRQMTRITKRCDSEGRRIVGIYVDVKNSENSLADYKVIDRLLYDAKNGDFQEVIVMKLDFIAYSSSELISITNALANYSIKLRSCEEQWIDYTSQEIHERAAVVHENQLITYHIGKAKSDSDNTVHLALTAEDVASMTGLCRVTIYKLCRSKRIPHNKIGHRYVFNRISIQKWLEENEVKPANPV